MGCYLNLFLVSQLVQVDQLNETKVLYDLHQINSVSRIVHLADGNARTAITARIVEKSILAAREEVRRKTISKMNSISGSGEVYTLAKAGTGLQESVTVFIRNTTS